MKFYRNQARFLCWIGILGWFGLAGCSQCSDTELKKEAGQPMDLGPTLARIGTDDQISLEELLHALRQYRPEERRVHSGINAQLNILNRLILSRMMVLESKKLGLDRSSETSAELLANQEGPLAALYIGAKMKELFSEDQEIVESELYEYYKSHSYLYTTGEKRRLNLILVRNNPDMSVEERAQAKKTIEKAKAKLQLGLEFGEVAKEFSQDNSASKGGDIGFIARDYELTIVKVAFGDLQYIGDTSDILSSNDYLRIIQLTEIKTESERPFETVKDEIREAVKKERKAKFQEGITQEAISNHLLRENREALDFDIDQCIGNQIPVAEFIDAPPITVEQLCNTLLEKAGFNPNILSDASGRVGVLQELIQRRAITIEANKMFQGDRDSYFNNRRMEERILFQAFNRYFLESVYQFNATESDLRLYYKNNQAKFVDPTSGETLAFEQAIDQVKADYDQNQKVSEYQTFLQGLGGRYAVIIDRPKMEAQQAVISAVVNEMDLDPEAKIQNP